MVPIATEGVDVTGALVVVLDAVDDELEQPASNPAAAMTLVTAMVRNLGTDAPWCGDPTVGSTDDRP